MDKKTISIIVPFYNEEASVSMFYNSISPILNNLQDFDFEIVCIDDGSSDKTLDNLLNICEQDSRMNIIELSRNFGKEAALTAGIDASIGDAVIPIDADLQDPPELIPKLIDEWNKGAEVVLARRIDRSADTLIKRTTARIYYRIYNRLSSLKLPENVGDFRLMDRNVVRALKQLPEQQRFMKGLFAWVGFKTTTITYKRKVRTKGLSKFSGWKLWNFALEGITSFSTVPLKLWSYLGLLSTIITFSYASFIIFRTIIYGIDVPGYASLLIAILFFGSIQLIGIGILGEYIGRIYMESKNRPLYIIRKKHKKQNES